MQHIARSACTATRRAQHTVLSPLLARPMTTVVTSSVAGEPRVPAGVIITTGASGTSTHSSGASATPAAAAPAIVEVVKQPVVEKVKTVKSEPAPPQFNPGPEKKKSGGLRARFVSFFVGFAVAAGVGMTWLRADLLQAVGEMEAHTAGVSTTLAAHIARLEQRCDELEAANKANTAAAAPAAPKKK